MVQVSPLQAAMKADAQASPSGRVFAPGFLAAAPARIAEDVDVGRPDGQPAILRRRRRRARLLQVLGAELGGDGVGDAWMNGASQVPAMPIACGNTVASPARATPCRPSFHQL
jgi:hypothetical protein